MFKSIFSKYFTVMSLIIVISFAAMGGMQMLFSSRYWMDDKQALLRENARNIAQLTASNTIQTEYSIGGTQSYEIVETTLTPVLSLLSDSIDSEVLITDNRGVVLICSEGNGCRHIGNSEALGGLVPSLNGKDYFTIGNLGGLYATSQYTAATPILKDGTPIGYVFASASAAGMGEYIRNNLQVFLLSALGCPDPDLYRAVCHDLPDGAPPAPDGGGDPQLWQRRLQLPYPGQGQGRGGRAGLRPQCDGGFPLVGGGDAPQLCRQCVP